MIREPQFEDVQSISSIIKILKDAGHSEEADIVLLMLCEWSRAAGYALGMDSGIKIKSEAPHE